MSSEDIRKQILGEAIDSPHDLSAQREPPQVNVPSESDYTNEITHANSRQPHQSKVAAGQTARKAPNPIFARLATALALSLICGPFGLLYFSWKKAVATAVLFFLFWSWQPNYFLLWWSGLAVAVVVLFGVGQSAPSKEDVGFRSNTYRRRR
jgi:hypothetical protein